MVGKLKTAYLQRPIKIPHFLIPARIQKCLSWNGNVSKTWSLKLMLNLLSPVPPLPLLLIPGPSRNIIFFFTIISMTFLTKPLPNTHEPIPWNAIP